MKKIRKILALALAVFMLAGLMPTNVFAGDTRTKINKIVATSDTDSIPKYGERVKRPTFTVTEGSPAYFDVVGGGDWCKKEGEKWKQYWEETFTEGTYRYEVQIRIDDEAGTTHVLDKNGVTVTVDGRKWADNERPSVANTFSLAWAKSKEYVITAPVGTPLDFVKKESWNIPLNYVGKAIETFSVAAGVAGGEKPYTFSRFSGPDWISVASDGTVSGTPNSVGTNENLVIRVTDKNSATKEITLTVAKTAQDPSTRTKINDIVATSDDIDGIPAYGGQVKAPTFTVTKGSPAYFNVEGNGDWCKKEGGKWKQYREKTFTEGTYRYEVQIRIDGEAGTTHVLDKNGVTVTVDGRKWADNERPSVADTFSYAWAKSKEYVISKTAQEKLVDIPKANTNLVYNGNPQTGVNEGIGYTITGNTKTNAGTYTAKATLEAGYKWKDGTKEVKNIPFEIKKARPTFTEPTGLKGKKDKKLSTVTLPSGFTWVDGETVLNTVGENTFKAKFTPADTTNYEVIDVDLTVKVEDVVTPPEKVTLTTNIINGHGTVTVTPASATVDKGNTIVVTFNPETNYEIDTVTLDGTDVKPQVVSNKLTITMDKSKTLWVGFKEKPITPPPTPVTYTLTASVEGGHGTVTPASATVKKGMSVEVTFNPETNYEIGTVTLDGTDVKSQVVSNKLLVNMNKDKTLTVKFKPTGTPTPTVESIKVISTDHKTEYKVGDILDVTNLKIEATMSDSTKTTKNVTAEMVSGFEPNTEGTQTLTITYGGKKTSYNVTVTADPTPPPTPTVASIAVNSTEHKTAYKKGESLDVSKLTILVTMSDSSTRIENVTAEMVSGFDKDTEGTQTLTITYEGKKTSYNVTVTAGTTPPTPPAAEQVTIKFSPGEGATGSMAEVKVDKNSEYTLPASTFTAPANKEFKAWKLDEEEKPVGSKINVGETDITLTAIWKDRTPEPPTPGEKVTITFDANGGEGTMADVTKNKGDSFTLPACTFTPPAGKEFKAWQVDGTEKNVGDNIEVNGDINIKAVWKDIGSVPPTPPVPPTPYTPYPWIVYPGWYYNFEAPKPKEEKPVTKMEMDWKIEFAIGTSTIDREINGVDSKIKMDVAPYIRDGRTMLPLRSLAEALGFEVEWNRSTRTVVLKDNNTRVEIPVGTNKIIVNGNVYTSDVKPEIKNNRTMLPIANLARALGLSDGKDIIWNSKSKMVTIYRSIVVK